MQADDDLNWLVIKPEIFAVIMDYYTANIPIVNEAKLASMQGAGSFSFSNYCVFFHSLIVTFKQMLRTKMMTKLFSRLKNY